MFQYNQPVGSRKDEPRWTLENIQLEVFCMLLAETRIKLPENPVHTVSAPFLEEKSLKSSN